MRSAPSGAVSAEDLTTKARIRDAAIAHIAAAGFRAATVRSIAAAADVSAALVLHHFGSKDGLRQVCDDHVATRIREYVEASASRTALTDLLSQLTVTPEMATLSAYCTQSLTDGGQFARRLFESVVADTELYLEQGTADGLIVPSSDNPGRARALAAMSLGVAMMTRYLAPDLKDPLQIAAAASAAMTGPFLEIYTHGLFTDDSYLRAYRQRPAGAGTSAGDPGPPGGPADLPPGQHVKKARKRQ